MDEAPQPPNPSKPRPASTGLLTRLMTAFFHLLYHPLAWMYDLVAGTVSLGRWQQWVIKTADLLPPTHRVLELGFGPGHLQSHLQTGGRQIFGLDESGQMARQAYRNLINLRSQSDLLPRLARGLAQALPFAAGTFDSIAATFPTTYIFQPDTLAEIHRVLRPNGQLIVLFAAWHTGHSLPERMMALLFRLTRQAPPSENIDETAYTRPFEQAGFAARVLWTTTPHSRLLFIIAQQLDNPQTQ